MAPQRSDTAGAEGMDAVLRRLVPMFDPPEGELLDEELVVALGEGRLGASEEAAALDKVRGSAAARAELRECFPEAWARHFGADIPMEQEGVLAGAEGPSNVIQGPWKRRAVVTGGVVLAMAASLALFMRPPAVPDGSELTVLRGVRSGMRGGEAGVSVEPGEKIDLLMKLGAAGRLDELRGAHPWGALLAVDSRGKARVVCTHDDPECRASEKTMAYLFTAPAQPGTTWFFFIASAEPVGRGDLDQVLDGLGGAPAEVAATLEGRLRAAADEHRWKLHAHPPLVVGAL